MGPPLNVCALVARTLGLLFNIPLMGLITVLAIFKWATYFTGIDHPTVLYVSGGNSQVIAYSANRYRIFG